MTERSFRDTPSKRQSHPYDASLPNSNKPSIHYDGTIRKQSPSFNNNSLEREDLQFYKSRCSDLERQLNYSRDQRKGGGHLDVLEFQDSRLRESTLLQLDNEKLAKIVQQKRTEADLWKQKYEN